MTAALAVLPGLDQRAGAVARVRADDLREKLGPTAWHVWTILCGLRDACGVVHPSIPGLARAKGYVPTPQRAVRSALARLLRVGLLRNVGWRVMEVPFRTRTAQRRVFIREVFGRFELDKLKFKTWTEAAMGTEWVVVVPSAVLAWMGTHRGRGGARPGAGRPRKSNVADGGNSNVANDLREGSKVVTSNGYGTSLREVPRARARPLVEGSESLGVIIGGGTARTPDPGLSTAVDGVPPYPGFNVVEPARVPPPPKLDPAATPADRAEQLVRAYRSAVEKRTGRPCRVLCRRGSVVRSKVYKSLLAGAAALIEHGIAPTAWALWSLDVFSRYGDTDERPDGPQPPRLPAKLRETPPIGLVFSAARIAKRSGWFSKESTSYTGGRAVFGPKLTDLHKRWAFMRAELSRGERDLALVVAACFPPERSYWSAVEAARLEAQQAAEQMLRRVARGECLWG